MRTRQLGNSDLHLTTVGFGAWAIGGGDWAFGWGPQDDAQSVRAIHRALDLGINWIDTAAIYGLGHSEEVVARALDGRADVIVATKCGLRWRDNGSVHGSLRAESIRQEVEDSLRRLRVETIDLYQVHWPNPDAEIEEGWAVMPDLIQEGKIRHAGVSNFSVEQLRRAQAIHPVASLQPPYSMIDRAVEPELLPFCAEHGVGVVAYSPLQCGLLTGAFDQKRLSKLPKSDWRRKNECFKQPLFHKILKLVRELRPVVDAADRAPLLHPGASGGGEDRRTTARLAIAWVLRRPEVTAAIVGARSPGQIEETAPGGDWELSPDELAEVDAIMARVAVPQPAGL